MSRGALRAVRPLLVVAAVLFVAVGATVFNYSYRRRQIDLDLDGTLIRKDISALQSKSGTGVAYIFVIRQKNGEEIHTPVPQFVYEKARVGMTIKKKSGAAWPTVVSK